MRMWMVDPKKMCTKHLLGEHVEIHMMVGTLKKGRSIQGFLQRGLLEPQNARSRHDELVAEMRARGFNHQSPLANVLCGRPGQVSREQSEAELAQRCPECRKLMQSLKAAAL